MREREGKREKKKQKKTQALLQVYVRIKFLANQVKKNAVSARRAPGHIRGWPPDFLKLFLFSLFLLFFCLVLSPM